MSGELRLGSLKICFSSTRFFLDNALKACVDAKLPKQLEATLLWFENVNNEKNIVDKLSFFINHEAMLRACKNRDFELVSILFCKGFKVSR